MKGNHHSEPSIKKDFFKVYEYGYLTTIVQKSWSFYSSLDSMDELSVNSEEQKVQDCLLSTNFYLDISTASVMNEKVCQINEWHDMLCYYNLPCDSIMTFLPVVL